MLPIQNAEIISDNSDYLRKPSISNDYSNVQSTYKITLEIKFIFFFVNKELKFMEWLCKV